MKKKEVVIINSTGGSPYHGPNFRSYYIGKNLLPLGYEVTIIANSYFHKFYNTPLLKGTLTNEVIDGLNYIWIKNKRLATHGSMGTALNCILRITLRQTYAVNSKLKKSCFVA